MKGLLIKDFKLIKGQKNFFLMIIVVAIGMAAFYDDVTFVISFLTFVISLFTLSTISYDEFDNGNAFLFTLPISRTGYAIEKYCFGLLLGCGSWLLVTVLAVIVSIVKETAAISDIVMPTVMILPIVLILQAIMIPFQLKFGGEKGRIAIIGAMGFLFVVGIAVVKVAEMLGINIQNIINNLPTVSMGMLVAMVIIVTIVLLLVSMKISMSIMNKKEF